MKIGYARVSTIDQHLELQRDALTKEGCERIFTDTASGAKADRPGLAQAIAYCRDHADDTLVVWKLDRLGRSMGHLIETVQALEDRGVGFKSLTENLDTTTPGGKLLFHIMGALAQFERDLIRERTNAGLQAAYARGRKGGRKPKLDTKQVDLLWKLYNETVTTKGKDGKEHLVRVHHRRDICRTLGISEPTMYRHIKERQEAEMKKLEDMRKEMMLSPVTPEIVQEAVEKYEKMLKQERGPVSEAPNP